MSMQGSKDASGHSLGFRHVPPRLIPVGLWARTVQLTGEGGEGEVASGFLSGWSLVSQSTS